MSREKIQADHAHENGDIEQRHRRFKEAVEQALLVRSSRDFSSREEYTRFLHFASRNSSMLAAIRSSEECCRCTCSAHIARARSS
jgi:hypothetical protein